MVALLVLLGGLAAFAVAWRDAAMHRPPGEPLLSRDRIASARLLAALTELGQVHVQAEPRVHEAEAPAEVGALRYSLRAGGEEPLPSRRLAHAALPELAQGSLPFDVVSLALDPRDWHDAHDGLLANALARGDAWQRGACLSMFEAGRLVAETTIGLRIHGDSSRSHREPGLRLALTPQFGCQLSPDRLLPGALGTHLVLRNETRQRPFANPMALEVFARLGVAVPKQRPVRVVLNGQLLQHVFFLCERLDETFLQQRLGHRRFISTDFKGDKPRSYDVDLAWLRNHRPLLLADNASMLDPEELLRWLTAVLCCNVYDSRQGLAWRELPRGPWHWIAWDLDWSLDSWPRSSEAMQVPTADVVTALDAPETDLRTSAMHHLLRDDPEFRRLLLQRVGEAWNHRLDHRWLTDLVARYRRIATATGWPDADATIDRIARFFVERPAALRAELARHLDLGPVREVRVRVAPGATVRIDGHAYDGDWVGSYFDGERCRVQVDAAHRLVHHGAESSATDADGGFVVLQDLELEVVRR